MSGSEQERIEAIYDEFAKTYDEHYVEEGPAAEFFGNPKQPRTREFLQRLRSRSGEA